MWNECFNAMAALPVSLLTKIVISKNYATEIRLLKNELLKTLQIFIKYVL